MSYADAKTTLGAEGADRPAALDMLRGRANNIASRIADLCDRMSTQAERMSINIDRLSGQEKTDRAGTNGPVETAPGRSIDQGGKLGELDGELVAIEMQLRNAERGFFAMQEQAERLQPLA